MLAGSEHGEVTVEREGERVKGQPGELGWQGGRCLCCLTIVCLQSLGHEWRRRLLTLACTASTPSHHSSCTHRTLHSDRGRYGGREGDTMVQLSIDIIAILLYMYLRGIS